MLVIVSKLEKLLSLRLLTWPSISAACCHSQHHCHHGYNTYVATQAGTSLSVWNGCVHILSSKGFKSERFLNSCSSLWTFPQRMQQDVGLVISQLKTPTFLWFRVLNTEPQINLKNVFRRKLIRTLRKYAATESTTWCTNTCCCSTVTSYTKTLINFITLVCAVFRAAIRKGSHAQKWIQISLFSQCTLLYHASDDVFLRW